MATCPDAVLLHLRGVVQRELDKVRALQRRVSEYNRGFPVVSSTAADDLSAAVAGIPSGDSLSVFSLAAYLACPLLPLAFSVELAELTVLDPTVLLDKVKGLSSGELSKHRATFNASLEASGDSGAIKLIRKLEHSLRRIGFDAASFAHAVVITASMNALFPTEFAAGPYQEFANAADGFAFSGGVPTTLNADLQYMVGKLQEAETRFTSLKEALG